MEVANGHRKSCPNNIDLFPMQSAYTSRAQICMATDNARNFNEGKSGTSRLRGDKNKWPY